MTQIVDPYTFAPGGTAFSSQINARFAAIIAVVNGELGTDNLAAGAVMKADLANEVLNGYLKLATALDLVAGFGTGTTTGFDSSAGRSRVAVASIAHGLARTPQFIFGAAAPVAIQEDANQRAVAVSPGSITATTFALTFTVNGTTNNSTTFYWLAVG